jgi:hypothetical protein
LCWLPRGWKRCVRSEYCFLVWGISRLTFVLPQDGTLFDTAKLYHAVVPD